MPGYADHKPKVLNRPCRIEGQVRGIERMVGDDAHCVEVSTQISAVTSAIPSCSSGPLGRLRWILGELAAIARRTPPGNSAQ